MGDESTDQTGAKEVKRRRKRVRVRYRREKAGAHSNRLRQFFNRHGEWLVPVVLAVLGVVVIWLAFKLYIGE